MAITAETISINTFKDNYNVRVRHGNADNNLKGQCTAISCEDCPKNGCLWSDRFSVIMCREHDTPATPALHPLRCETCDIHKKVCNNLPYYYGKDLPHPSSGCTLYDMMDTEPDFSDAYWNAIALVGCASHTSSTPDADARERIEKAIGELEYVLKAQADELVECHIHEAIALLKDGGGK